MSEHNINTFSGFLAYLEDGETSSDLMEQIKAVIERCAAVQAETKNDASGELTLTIKAKVSSDGLVLLPSIKTKLPEVPRRKTRLFVADGHGNMTAIDPKQHTLFDESGKPRMRTVKEA